MAEWLYEEGIGEARAGLIEHGRLVEALVERETEAARAGAVVQGRLIATLIPKKRGVVRLLSGEEALLEPIPPRLAEGATVLVEILREAIAEHDFAARGVDISADEIFVSDGAKCDSANILDILGSDNRVAVCDPVYPVAKWNSR